MQSSDGTSVARRGAGAIAGGYKKVGDRGVGEERGDEG